MEIDGIKSVPFKVKAAGPDDGLESGQFEGYASVFGNVDSYGDIVVKGAFAKSLAEWQEKGDPIPLLWGHDFSDPFSNIGAIDTAEEDDHGLKVRGTFDLDNPKAAQVYRLAKGRRTTGMSFAYDVEDQERKDDANYLKTLRLYEASIVPVGANPLAGVDAVKSGAAELAHEMKAGRVLAGKHIDSLRQAQEAIGAVIEAATADGDEDDQGKASGATGAKSDASGEPDGARSPSVSDEDQGSSPSVDPILAAISVQEKEI